MEKPSQPLSSLSNEEGSQPLLDEEARDYSLRKNANSAKNRIFYAIFVISALILSITNVLLWYHHKQAEPRSRRDDSITLTCGETIEEARRNRCQFDVMAYSWTPSPCLNYTHTLLYFNSDNWPFWLYENRTETVSIRNVLLGTHSRIFTMWSFHIVHCQYTLSRTIQVLPAGGPINDYMRDFNHTSHCLELVQAHTDQNQMLDVSMGFSSCTVVM
jgi:hypothetical protein